MAAKKTINKENEKVVNAADDNKKAVEDKVKTEQTEAISEKQQGKEFVFTRILEINGKFQTGKDVKELQNRLKVKGYNCGQEIKQGKFARHTAYAVRCFQVNKGLIVDGRAGEYTIKALGGVWDPK